MTYTIGIKRKWLPGYKKYRVTAHRTQFQIGEMPLTSPRLVLTLENGDELAIPNATELQFILYADFKVFQAELRHLEREREEDEKLRQEEELKEVLYREHMTLKSMKAAELKDVVPIQKQA